MESHTSIVLTMLRLHRSSHYGDAQEVKEILDRVDPFLVNYADQLGQTSLHFASSAGHVDVAKVLLPKGANVNARDIDGRTPLLLACSKDHAAVVDLLLRFDADVEKRTYRGQTPLHIAAMAGATQAFRLLVEFGANFNASLDGRTPLDCPHLQSPPKNHIWFIEHHMIKMASARLPYIKLAAYHPGVMGLERERVWRKECLAELDKLKGTVLSDTKISLHDFLTRPNSVHNYLRNPKVFTTAVDSDFVADFPIYGRLLDYSLFKGLRRLALLETAAFFFPVTRHFSGLPAGCVEKICSFLDDQSLANVELVWEWSQSKNVLPTPTPLPVNSGPNPKNLCVECNQRIVGLSPRKFFLKPKNPNLRS